MPTYLAANLHIWRQSPYPPPGEAVGSRQLDAIKPATRPQPQYQKFKVPAAGTLSTTLNYIPDLY